jgi:hypothetical protein
VTRAAVRLRGVDVFDAVVIAAPLEYAGLKVKGFSLPANAKNKRPYQVTHTTFVAGELNASMRGTRAD